ncbi:DUF6416 domain-containing protein [Actinomadura gamaensis]|uniref:DUF6416 domain-containing protein n=1 Tax=Actinomadura gamaensis TaxID=1763541 RepID=A0ABV9UBQ4_9ACTN
MRIDDDDPMWDDHSGGSGHDGPEWEPGDEDLARIYWEKLGDTPARDILLYLIRRPGQLVHRDELGRELRLDPTGRKRLASVVASRLRPTGAANAATGRSFPFRWWKKQDGTRYAVKHQTAEVFEAALKTPES